MSTQEAAPTLSVSGDTELYDVLGCGFGPANLAIAAGLTDKWAAGQAKGIQRAIFIEKHPEFLWHPGMLIPGSRMQISCLKDLVTLRNPSSPLTFLSYLHSQNRLAAFINRGSTIPTRREFADYLSWAAHEVEKRGVHVAYAEEVVRISKIPAGESSRDLVEVTSRRTKTGELVTRRTKCLILSPGGSPLFPPAIYSLLSSPEGLWSGGAVSDAPIIHSSSYMTSIEALLSRLSHRPKALRIALVGSGQSAAECLLDVHRRLESLPAENGIHEIHMIIRKGSLKPSDDSPFVNEIFDPDSTNAWYNYPTESSRRTILAEYKNTNYGVVNPRTLDTLYELAYDQKLSDGIAARTSRASSSSTPRVTIRPFQKIIAAVTQSVTDENLSRTVVSLACQHSITHDITDTTYDAVICGTGYDRTNWLRLLRTSNLAEEFGLGRASNERVVAKLAPEHQLPSTSTRDHEHEHTQEPEVIKYRFVDYCEQDGDRAIVPSLTDSAPQSSSESSMSTPPSSPGLSLNVSRQPATVTIRISRPYRLIPSAPNASSSIYLQGCAEATHGLSDTLLSVLGVRAGEVLDDLCRNLEG